MDPEELRSIVNDMLISRYTYVATFTLLVYDYAILAREEARYIWPAKLSAGKLAFLLNRYMPFVSTSLTVYSVVLATDMTPCRPVFLTAVCVTYIHYLVVVSVMFFRAYAIWDRKRSMLIFLMIFYACIVAASAVVTGHFFAGIAASPTKILPTGCVFTFGNTIEWAAMVILLCCESLSLFLVLWKTYTVWRYRHSSLTLLESMARDGGLYFACILMISTSNLVVIRQVSPLLRNFLLLTQGDLQSILCTRLLLHTRTVQESLSYGVDKTTSSNQERREGTGVPIYLRPLPSYRASMSNGRLA